jgi:hypothetical protein
MQIRAKRLRRAAMAAGAVAAAGLAGCQSAGTHFAQGGVARGETYANSSAVAQKQSSQQMMIAPGTASGQTMMTAGQPGMMIPGQPLPANQTMMMSGPPMVGSGGTVYPVNYTPAAGPQMMQVMPTNFTPPTMPGPAMMQTQQQVTATLPVTPGAIGQPTIMLVNGPNGPQYVITEMVSQSPAPTGAQMIPAPTMAASTTFTPAMPAPVMPAPTMPTMPAPAMPAPIMPAATTPAPVVSAPSALPAPITPVMTPTAFSDVAPAPLPTPTPTPIASPSPAPTPMPPPIVPAPAPAPAPTFTPPAPINVPTPPMPALPPSNEVSFKAPGALPPTVNFKSPTGPVLQSSDTTGPSLSSLPAPALGPIVPAKLPPATGTAPDDEISSAPVFVPVAR